MNEDLLITKIQKLREEWTLEQDKAKTFAWEQAVRVALIKKDLQNLDGIKALIEELTIIIKDISYLICFDNTLAEIKRTELFAKREAYMWLINFFQEPNKTIDTIENNINNELKG